MGSKFKTQLVAWSRRPWFYFLLALMLALPLVFLTTVPPVDVASRYVPMATAFADGNWAYAFHPRVPVLFPVLGGGFVFLTGCDGFLGVKLASTLLFALAVFPLFALFLRILSRKYAVWGVIFYLFCHLLLQYAGEGVRDNGKTLSIALAAWALLSLWDSRDVRWYLLLGAAVGLGFLFRTELLVVGGCLLLTAAVRECWKRRLPWRSCLGGVVVLLMLTPVTAVNRHFTGYPVPDVRLALWLQAREAQIAAPRASVEEKPVTSAAVPGRPDSRNRTHSRLMESGAPPVVQRNLDAGEYLGDLFRGFYPPFLLPVLLGIAWRVSRRCWSSKETLLVCIVVGNALVTALLIILGERYWYISRRYLLPVAPLLFGWSGYFAVSLWDFCRERWPKWFPVGTGVLIFVVCGGILYGAALSPMIRNFTSKKRHARNRAIFTCAEILRRDYRGESSGERTFLLQEYRSCRRPFVMVPDRLEVAPMLAGGSRIYDRRLADYLILGAGERPSSRQWREVGEVRGYRDERYVIWGNECVSSNAGGM